MEKAEASVKGNIKKQLSAGKRFLLNTAGRAAKAFFRRLPLKNCVFFYTIRTDGKLEENSKCVYDALDAEKKVFARKLPHSAWVKPKIYYGLLTSKVIVTDDYVRYLRAFELREEQKVIQLWHGCGAFKKWSLSAPSLLTPLEEAKTHAQYDAVAVSSESVRPFFVNAFGVTIDKIMPFGIPRTDALLSPDGRAKLEENFYLKHPALKGKRIYAYMPTFRETGGVRVDYDPGIDWQKLSEELEPDEAIIIKNHPAVKQDFLKGKSYGNIMNFSGDNSFEILAAAAALITDYSSIMYEAILLDKPVVFYCPDFALFERDFYLKYPDDLPGPAILKADNLLQIVRETAANPPHEKMKTFRVSQLDACDGRSTQRYVDLIQGYLKG